MIKLLFTIMFLCTSLQAQAKRHKEAGMIETLRQIQSFFVQSLHLDVRKLRLKAKQIKPCKDITGFAFISKR